MEAERGKNSRRFIALLFSNRNFWRKEVPPVGCTSEVSGFRLYRGKIVKTLKRDAIFHHAQARITSESEGTN